MYWLFYSIITKNGSGAVIELCSSKPCSGIADSSNNAIIGPKEDILRLNDILEAKMIPLLGRFYVDCDTVMKLPKINFVLAGQSFTLNGKQYTQKVVFFSSPQSVH